MNLFNKLKEKWGIKSNWDFFLINVVFSCAGMLIVYERRPIFDFIGMTPETPLWIKIAVYIPLVFPLYQLNLVVFGFLFGQFSFFWTKQKKMGRFLLKLLRKNSKIT